MGAMKRTYELQAAGRLPSWLERASRPREEPTAGHPKPNPAITPPWEDEPTKPLAGQMRLFD